MRAIEDPRTRGSRTHAPVALVATVATTRHADACARAHAKDDTDSRSFRDAERAMRANRAPWI